MWKLVRRVIPLMLVSAGAWAATPPPEGEPAPYRLETGPLILEWVAVPDSSEIVAVTAEATRLYASVAAVLGIEPEDTVTIVLGGPSERPGGKRETPRVDSRGRILLFQFTPDFRSYFGALAHEMAHAFRFERRWTADWFFEEGLAEFVALRADSSLSGFPWFDFPVSLVAGQWAAAGQDIPMSALQARHADLNQRCGAQSYALRSAFFDWLGRTYGDDVVVRAGNESPAGSLESYPRHFGKSLEDLASDWREALLADYRAIDGVEALAKRYRQESPVRYQRTCSAGQEF